MKTFPLNTRTAIVPKLNEQELANRIYDSLMQNVGLSPYHVAFNVSIVEDCEVCHNIIHLKIAGIVYKITITEDIATYFDED